MVFTQFKTLRSVLMEYELAFKREVFLSKSKPIKTPEYLSQEIAFNLNNLPYKASEIAIGENLIYPILKEISKEFIEHLLLWSHPTITASDLLTGVPDYIFARNSTYSTAAVGMPILVAVEAKKEDFEAGWGQCAAEMVAAQKLNEIQPLATIYGIVTIGEIWQFAKLNQKMLTDNLKSYTIFDLDELYSVLFEIINDCKNQIISFKTSV